MLKDEVDVAYREMKFSDPKVQFAYDEMKKAQRKLIETEARVAPRLKEIQSRRDELSKQKEFCLMMAMACFAAPTIILLVIAIYRMVA